MLGGFHGLVNYSWLVGSVVKRGTRVQQSDENGDGKQCREE